MREYLEKDGKFDLTRCGRQQCHFPRDNYLHFKLFTFGNVRTFPFRFSHTSYELKKNFRSIYRRFSVLGDNMQQKYLYAPSKLIRVFVDEMPLRGSN